MLSRLRGPAAPESPESPLTAQTDAARLLVKQGNDLEDSGRLQEALAKYDQALATAPSFASAQVNRGNIFLAVKQPGFAAEAYQQAIALQPDLAAAHFNLGNALVELNKTADAVRAYEKAAQLKPDFIDAWIAHGNAMGDTGHHEGALKSYEQAVRLAPNFGPLHRNMGLAFRQLGKLREARVSLETSVRQQPNDIDALCDLGNVSREMGDLTAAIHTARRASEVTPHSAGAHSLLLFCLSHSASISAQDLYLEHLRFGEKFEKGRDYSTITHANTKTADRVLKVGVVSADLRNHAVASFFEPLYYLLLQSSEMQLHVYDNGGPQDEVSERMKASATHWTAVTSLSDPELANLIRKNGIDVLIDLSGHTPGHRLLTLVEKPAPLQLSWMGYPGTTGMRCVDYYLADPHFLPAGEFDAFFSEKIIRLPANAPFRSIDHPPNINPLPALSNGHMTFGSFNRLDKISKDVVALWSALLCAIPNAKMVVGGMPLRGELTEITGWFQQNGVAVDRLTFHRRSGMYDYLKLHHDVDVCLDTFPYGGGTTTCHALWMGVPTLTLAGKTPAAVSSRSILSHADVKDLFVSTDAAEFVEKGKWCAEHLDELQALRGALRSKFQGSAMTQPEAVAGGLQTALRFAWQRWCQDLAPTSFEVTHQAGQYAVANQ